MFGHLDMIPHALMSFLKMILSELENVSLVAI